jgi:NCS1 nucleoside transporter family
MSNSVVAEIREGTYGSKVSAIEPGGSEFIPLSERHGKARDLFTIWATPNLEFATVFVGMIAVLFFGLNIWQATVAVVLGSLLGAISHGLLGARGPLFGVPEMVISRIPFGWKGNSVPSGLNALLASLGWFAVNTVTGTFALTSLLDIPVVVSLVLVVGVQVVFAFFGHNMIHKTNKIMFPFSVVAFILAFIWIVPSADYSVNAGTGTLGGFLIALGAAFGYASGWNPFASDYSRYLPQDSSKKAVALWSGAGLFLSCSILMFLGVLAATLVAPEGATPTDQFTSTMPTLIAAIVLLAVLGGSVIGNSLNVYSATMSFLSLPIKISSSARRTIATVIFGAAGGVVAYFGLQDPSRYTNFLLVIAYWVAPWLGVVFMDQYLRRKNTVSGFLFDKKHNPIAGVVAFVVAMVVSVVLFSNQVMFVGIVPSNIPQFGDSAPLFGFVIAAVLYAVLYKFQKSPKDEELIIETPKPTKAKAKKK